MISEAVSDLVRNRIQDRIGEYFPYLLGTEYEVMRVPFLGNSSYPICLYQIKSRGCVREEIFAKFPPVSEANNEGETEYKWLRFLFPKISVIHQNIGVPRPLDFYDDVNALLTVKLEGRNFKQVLLKYNSFMSSIGHRIMLDYYIDLCGRWLRTFHDLTRSPNPKCLDNTFFQRVYEQLAQLQSYGFPQAISLRIGELQHDIEAFAIRHPMTIASQHGDFGASNIIINRDYVYVIDLSYSRNESIYKDIGTFLAGLWTINPMPWHPTYDYRRLRYLKRIFLRSYFGQCRTIIDEVFVEIYSLRHMIMRCLDHYDELKKLPAVFFKPGAAIWSRLYLVSMMAEIERIENCLSFMS